MVYGAPALGFAALLRHLRAESLQQAERDLTAQVESEKVRIHFYTSLAHELRSPMQLLMGHAYLALEENTSQLTSTQQNALNVILKTCWEVAQAAAPKPFRLSWQRSARGNWWARHKDWHVVVFRRDDGRWATRMQRDGRDPIYLKATATDASWAMEGLDASFAKRFGVKEIA